ncbi:sushi, von Willebrand factor type A, EGF and pentraxin domain-containing protein 1-like isoform X2 [Pimephales promelas]|uniref:sushi, von Willebrand factor type A, EGF and pentraxin domain-containing protein 1-like isoform X2 n=1 Tax=Pimephales promelas TaxID=90988 RepID=UPI00195585DF|nr:sushi, von Willebrand factor type A, EGF and pentraxin domain-containing protein 1-like isoform X2 [Pimephales promelas]
MRAPIQFISFSCFLFSVTFVQGQEIRCEIPRDQHVYLPEYYFSGDKKLGARISYYCMYGYDQMSAEATCTRDGWTPNPLCAEVTCELKSTTYGVRRINPEGKTIFKAGESVEITCTERYWIFRTKEIIQSFTCGENGQWDHEPVCAEIRCEVPRDQHVSWPEYYFSGDKKLGARISYACMSGYDQMSAEATCTRDGWTPNPLCADEVTCELKSTTYGVKRINPEGKTIFRAGESVEITCTERYWIFRTKENTKSFTCGENGQWDHEPVCAEIRCEVPRDQHVYLPESYFRGDKMLGARISYYCTSGYYKMSAEATCTRDGWTPNTLCAVNTCAAPIIRNAEILGDQRIIYNINSIIQYQCNRGFEPEQPVQITCTSQNQWTGIQQCTEIRCEVPRDQHVYLPEYYFSGDKKLGARISYYCMPRYDQMFKATCTRDGWTPNPLCAEVTCELKPTRFGIKRINPEGKTIFKAGESVEITCTERYWIFRTKEIIQSFTCGENGQWDHEPVCAEIRCEVPRDQHVYLPESYFSGDKKLGARISYYCMSGYDQMSAEATCTRDGWTPNPLCAGVNTCAAPIIPNAEILGDQRTKYNINSRIQYKCNPGFEPEQPVQITCTSQNQWTGIQECTGMINEIRCKVPDDPHVYRPDIYFNDLKLGVKLLYECMPGFDQMSVEATCTQDGWTPNPLCADEVTCELKSTTVGVKRINPEGKTIFRAGESVEITCTERYWIFRTKEIIQSFTCGENGQWDHEPVCAEIRCKVPDDQRVVTPEVYFNDLKLGEKISYACMPGYDKMSAEATCTRDGWTPNPLCAEVTCELKSTRFGIKRINPEGKTIFKAGESVEITCTERYSIFRTKEIIQSFTCGENGQWDHEPACAEIRCEVPRDQHVYSPESYFSGDKKLGARISYYCTSGYDKMSAEATCTRDGWTPNPLCAEVTCELKSTTYGVRRINPEGKTIFKAGESVEITCTERYWIFGTKENIQSFTCGENGQWDHEPVCAEIRCEVPRDQYVSWPDYYFSGDKKLGARTSYACVSGYYQMSAEATCTRDGWTPKPLCAGNTCAAPNIPNAAILGDQKTIYNINSRIQYQCNPGFEPEQPVQITCTSQNQWTVIRQCTKKQKTCRDLSVVNGFTYSNTSNKEEIYYSCNTGYKSFSGNWWDSATCNKDSWSDETQCIPEDQCGAFPSVHHGKLKKTKQTFRDGDKIEFECDPGFIATPHSIRCINGKWEKPVCKVGVHCDIPPKVENALITSKPEELYVDESSVTYACRSSFSINGTSTVFCRNGIWEETPTCEEIRCKVPDDQRLVTPEQNFTDLKLGEKMSYACMTGYDKMSAEATCTRDGWTPNPLCADEVTCELKSTRFGIKRINPEGKTIFKAGESVEITCTEKHWFYGTKEKIQSFTCGENGQWDHEPVCAEVRCEVPRGQYVYDPEYYFRGDKKLGARKSYYCTSGYDQMFEATCTRDGWTPNPLCAVNTCAAPIIPNVQILGDQRTKYNINSRIQYQCNPGFKPEQPVQITCNSQKQWTGIQQCTEIRCEVPHNQHVYDLYSYFRGNEKLGAKMSYACVSGYYQMSVEATCTRDGWTPNPLCAVNTCAAPIIPNAAILGDQRIIYNINSRIQYQCNPGFEPEQPVQITCTSQNQWTGIQECTGIINENTCKVPDDHRVSRPELYFTDLKLGATISYYCMSGYYQMSAEATCTRDGWTPNPLCADGQ